MLALAFTIFVFVYWAVLGRAIIEVAFPRLGVLRAWLFAPAVGLAVILLGLMLGNQAGLPIRTFVAPLTIVLGLLAVGVLLYRRPITPWRKLVPFAAAILVAWLWTGWPAFETGFHWISYANDDMANYCLAAQRFMDHGFYAVPTHADLAGRDYASYYFFMHVADMMRFGAEHLVAWSASLAHVPATQAFMPAIVALGLVQITSAGALVLHLGRWRRHALVTVWILAISPLFMLGTLYQLIAQVGGVALLLTTVALLLRPWPTLRRKALMRYAILPSITSAALCIFYPEVTPFAVLTFLAFAALWVIRHRALPATLLTLATYTLAGVFVLLRHNIISYVSILIVQSGGAFNAANLLLSLFPYFMIPTGFSNLFGWMPIAHDFPEPVLSLSIAVGMIIFAAILVRAVRQAWRLSPAAILLLLQFGLAVRLFDAANDFGLYKLAMWMQPVLAAGLASLFLWATRGRIAAILACLAAYALTTAPTAYHYTNASRGVVTGGLTELRLASKLGLHPQLPADHNAQLTSTIENVVAAKFAASELRGYPLALVSRDYFFPSTRWDYAHPTWPLRLQPHFNEMSQALPLINWRNSHLIEPGLLWRTQFTQAIEQAPTDYYVSIDPRLSLFNKFEGTNPPHQGIFVIEPAALVHNRVIFVHSWLGNHYYLGDRRRIAFFQQEEDLFAPGHQFNGIGRFMLLRIDRASPKIYLRVSATRTLVTGRTAWNSRAIVRAAKDVPLGAIGNGAFNLFVGPVTPETFDGVKYVALDFAEYPHQLLDYRSGLKRLYHQQVSLDYRRVLGWARDISAISESEYADMPRPRAIAHFPEDLAQARTLEFSGAYEDGWLSPHSRFVLAGASPGELLRLRGVVPQLENTALGTGALEVVINGTKVCALPMPLGRFDCLLPIPEPGNTTAIDLQFTATAPLPGRDSRPVGAKLEYLGFADVPATIDYSYDDPHAAKFAAIGIDEDGWTRRTASVVLPPMDRPSELTMQLEYPPFEGRATRGVLHARVDDSSITTTLPLEPGTRPVLRLMLPASKAIRVLHLDAPAEYQLSAPDHRVRAVRVTDVKLAPAATT